MKHRSAKGKGKSLMLLASHSQPGAGKAGIFLDSGLHCNPRVRNPFLSASIALKGWASVRGAEVVG